MVCTLTAKCTEQLNKAKGCEREFASLTFLYKITTIKIIMKKYLRKIKIKIFLKIIIILIVNIQNPYKMMYTKYKTGKDKIKI